jgi:hypothetical protein
VAVVLAEGTSEGTWAARRAAAAALSVRWLLAPTESLDGSLRGLQRCGPTLTICGRPSSPRGDSEMN